MSSSQGFSLRRTSDAELSRRARLIEAFERSGLSAAEFARRQRLTYTTFCSWRQQHAKARPSPAFVQVELPATAAPIELTIELGAQARLRLSAASQIALAAELIQAFNAKTAC